MPNASVLIIEDEELQRRSLERALRNAGFEVVACGDADAARTEVVRRGTPFHVVILDMLLERDTLTGAALGKEFLARDEWKHRPPEFLVNSAKSEESYYEQALKLGVAAYLKKDNHRIEEVVDHVRVLALRRSLSLDNGEMLGQSRLIAAESRDGLEATRRFCESVIIKAFEDFLPLESILLLTMGENTHAYATRTGTLRGANPVFSIVQALTHGTAGGAEPFVVDSTRWESVRLSPETSSASVLRLLDQAALVPFLASQGIRLSVGILPTSTSKEDALRGRQLAQLVLDFLRPSIVDHLLQVLAHFSELEAKRRAVLKATSTICLFVGQQQLAALDAAGDVGEISTPGPFIGRLRSLANDLVNSGGLLGELICEPIGRDESVTPTSLLGIVGAAWHEVSRVLTLEDGRLLTLSGEGRVECRSEYLQLAVGRILLWFARRQVDLLPEASRSVEVLCFKDPANERTVVLQIEDRSPRLPDRLREQLMEPFASAAMGPTKKDIEGPGQHLALYLAKMLIEEGCQGRLLDRSHELEGAVGHRFVLRLPSAVAMDETQVA